MVALADDDGVLIAQVAKTGKGGAKHGVSAHKTETALAIELWKLSFHRGNIAQYTILGECRNDLLERLDGILHRSGIDDQLGGKLTYLLQGGEATGVVHKAQALGVNIVYCRFVLKTQQIGKEGAHLTSSENQYSHNFNNGQLV